MRTLGPLLLGMLAGWFAFGELFIPHPSYRWLFELFRDFAQVLTATAYILGGLNLIQVNYPKIRRRDADWQYKVLMLSAALVVGLSGIEWHTFGGVDESGEVGAAVADTSADASVAADVSIISFETAHREALVSVDGRPAQRAWYTNPAVTPDVAAADPSALKGTPADLWSPAGDKPLSLSVKPGVHEISVFMPVAGYEGFKKELEVGPGQKVTVSTNLVMRWGAGSPEGRVFTWFYDYIFYPCNATMFALLAFFIASAAFRAFRARNVESALLLGSAILVMIGLVPIGRLISPFFPELADWIVDFPNNAGRRAIMMGAALGAIVTGLRVILGLERSHLGQDT